MLTVYQMKLILKFLVTPAILIILAISSLPTTQPVFALSCSVSPTTIQEGDASRIRFTGTGLRENVQYQYGYRDRFGSIHNGVIGRSDNQGRLTGNIRIVENVAAGSLTIFISETGLGGDIVCTVTVTVGSTTPTPTSGPTGSPTPTGGPTPTGSPLVTSPSPSPSPCIGEDQVHTAFGCLATEPARLISDILAIAVGIAGGIAFILMVVGGIRMLVSGGDPEALAAGRDMLTSAIAGLLFIIFSVVILRIIGINILKLPFT